MFWRNLWSFIVEKNYKFNIVNKQGKFLLKKWVDDIDVVRAAPPFIAKNCSHPNGHYTIVDASGKIACKQPMWFEIAKEDEECGGTFNCYKNGKWYVMDRYGNFINDVPNTNRLYEHNLRRIVYKMILEEFNKANKK